MYIITPYKTHVFLKLLFSPVLGAAVTAVLTTPSSLPHTPTSFLSFSSRSHSHSPSPSHLFSSCPSPPLFPIIYSFINSTSNLSPETKPSAHMSNYNSDLFFYSPPRSKKKTSLGCPVVPKMCLYQETFDEFHRHCSTCLGLYCAGLYHLTWIHSLYS